MTDNNDNQQPAPENSEDNKPEEETEKIIADLQAQLESAESAKLRALADLENFRRRENENKINWSNMAVAEFLKNVLPSFLEFDLFAQNSTDENAKAVVDKFFTNLEKSGLEKIEPQTGEDINPDLHEVLMTEEGEAGKIVRCLEIGWKLGTSILRPAKVTAAQS